MSSFASTSTLEVPHGTYTHTTRAAPDMRMLDPMDTSFGYTLALSSSATHESRHDGARRQSLCSEILPAYDEEAAIPLPAYTLHAPEPLTLAMYLFKFGFLFPPFWVFGSFILLSPLREPPSTEDASTLSWMPEKSEEERQAIIESLRKVELKWARRCLCAFAVFAVVIVGCALVAWGILKL